MRKSIATLIIFLFILVGFWILIKQDDKVDEAKSKEISFYNYFDTVIKIKVFGDYTNAEIATLKQDVEKELAPYNQVVDRFNKYDNVQNIFLLNEVDKIDYNQDLDYLISSSTKLYNEESKQLNIALGPVIDIWKKYITDCNDNSNCRVPSDEELQSVSTNIDPNDIVITDKSITTSLGMKVDLGAVAKGYGADKIAEILEHNGYGNYLINAGGNVLVSKRGNGVKFKIGIVNPNDVSKTLMTLKIEDKAVVTSGDYERFYEVGDVRYHHLINNETLYPSSNFKSVTVITDSSFKADAYSTMLFGMSLEEGKTLAESKDEMEVIWILGDGTVEKTSGASKYE